MHIVTYDAYIVQMVYSAYLAYNAHDVDIGYNVHVAYILHSVYNGYIVYIVIIGSFTKHIQNRAQGAKCRQADSKLCFVSFTYSINRGKPHQKNTILVCDSKYIQNSYWNVCHMKFITSETCCADARPSK